MNDTLQTSWSLLVARLVLGVVWLDNGLINKVLMPAPHHLAVVQEIGSFGPLSPTQFLLLLGCCETLLACAVIAGVFHRFIAAVQIVVVVAMNGVALLSARGALPDPIGLVVTNLPFLACAFVVGALGPGRFARRWPR